MKKQILSMLLVLCMVLSMMPVSVFASTTTDIAQASADDTDTANTGTAEQTDISDTEAQLLWEYTKVEGGIELTAYKGAATDVYVPSFIEVDGENLRVISLADGLFKNNDALNSVTLGKGILKIGDEVFYDCDNMVCILISEELTTIGVRAFYSCDNFNSVILYDTVESIGTDAFSECPKLKVWCNDGTAGYAYATENSIPVEVLNPDAEPELHVIDGVTYYVMNGEAYVISCDDTCSVVNIRSTISNAPVTRIREAFKNCVNLEKVVLPDTVRIIDSWAFYNCENLVEMNLPDGITEIGPSAFRDCNSLLVVKLPSTLTKLNDYIFYGCSGLTSVILPDGLESIGTSAFSSCSSLVDIEIPSTVSSFGSSAFYGCESLESVNIPNTITLLPYNVFGGCKNLTNVSIPISVTEIGAYAFYGCDSLTEFNIPQAVTTIGSYAFTNCDSLRTVIIPEGLALMYVSSFGTNTIILVHENSYAHNFAVNNNLWYEIYNPDALPEFYEIDGVSYAISDGAAVALNADNSILSVTIPEQVNGYPVKEIRGAFRNCSALTSIVLPESLETVSVSAFAECSSLTEIEIPSGVLNIPNSCFKNCTSLEKVVFPDNIETIGEHAFAECSSLTEIEIPSGVLNISNNCFKNCTSLEKVVFPDNIETIGSYAFENCILKEINMPSKLTEIGAEAFCNCDGIKELSLPGSLKSVYRSAFSDCDGLTSVTIPGSVSDTGESTFTSCDNLEKVVVEDGVTMVGMQSFQRCPNLKEVILPDSIVKIYLDAFEYCYKLKHVIIPENTQHLTAAATGAMPDAAFKDINPLFLVYENSYAHEFFDGSKNMVYALYDGQGAKDLYEIDGVSYAIIDSQAVAYYADEDLTEVTLPTTVNGYPLKRLYATFRNCPKLKSVEIPYGVEKIDVKAFYNCVSLESVDLPESVIELRYDAFGGCSSLKEISLPKSLTIIRAGAFTFCDSLESIHIPENVTTLEGAFTRCTGLTSVRVSANLTNFPTWAFENCVNLRSVIVDKNLKGFSLGAFRDCKNLSYVQLHDGFENVGDIAFTGCKNLRTILLPESVKFFTSGTFDTSTVLLVYENSTAHQLAVEYDYNYFIMHKTENPLINYGTGLSGVVTYTDGSVASGATVDILYDDGKIKETVVADENGAYTSTYAEVGDYIIRATDAQGNTATTQASVKRMNVFEVFVTGDTNPVLKKSYSVSGTVNEGGATVTITDEKGNIIQSVVADENGNFAFDDIPNGTYVVTAKGEDGSVVQEVTVFDADLSGIYLEIIPESVTIWGLVEVEDRKGNKILRNWVDVTIYNSDGTVVAQCKTDSDGKYLFEDLSVGEYSIVVETFEMREDKHYGYDRNHKLTGYAYVNVTETGEHQADTIVLKEAQEYLSIFEGKVTANGETQDCQVILRDSNRNEIARLTTKKNGKFSFSNICDGVYYILAITKSDGMGYTVVTVKDGVVYGDTDIRVYKSDKVQSREAEFEHDVPTCHTREDALKYKDRIAQEKRFYDGLSEKEKKQLSEFYIERLNKLAEWIANVSYETPENVVVEQGGLVVSGSEIESESDIVFSLNIKPVDNWQANENGIENKEDYIYHDINSAAGERDIKQYYEITMTKTVDGEEKVITSVRKDTDAMGKFRITLPIPDEHKGHKHYSMVHVHNDETILLADLDDDPDTITVEISEFSTFVLTATDTIYSSVLDILGDTDLDGEITILDATDIQLYLVEKLGLTDEALAVADALSDGVISIMDATRIQMYLADLITEL